MRDRYSTAFYLLKQGLMDERLSDLLWNIWARDAADPRDRLFAMLSLAGRSRGWAHGDYNRSVKQVFCGAARDIIREENSLEILLAARSLNKEDEAISLPSWGVRVA
ncbi:heterokaryon incompatibility protein [Colletotrichum filicis]|nr:heterokaryon incompatibility protein [Colletotrichum filicis]